MGLNAPAKTDLATDIVKKKAEVDRIHFIFSKKDFLQSF